MILALITSPISFSEFAFASNHEESDESDLAGPDGSTRSDTSIEVDVEEEQEDEIELKGILTVTGDDTFNLETADGTEAISINVDTEIDDDLSLSDLDGLEVEVEAVLIDGVLFATEIEFDVEEELEGTIVGDPVFDDETSGSFTLKVGEDTFMIVFNVDTEFDDLVANDLEDGLEVEVDTVLIDGVLFATEIEFEAEEEVETDKVETDEVETDEVETDEVDTTTPQASISNLGQEVSNFVHESRDYFKEQKVETKKVIAQCRVDTNNAVPSDRQSVREQCKSDLKEIRDSYKDLRQTYHDMFKAFRDDLKILIKEYKGLEINEGEKAAALANIDSLSQNEDKEEYIKELQQKMKKETKAETKQLREQMKKDREIARETMKDLREDNKVAEKMLREDNKAAEKELRETDPEAAKELKEGNKAAEKKLREDNKAAEKDQRQAEKDQREMVKKEREALRVAGIESEDEDAEDAAEDAAEADEDAAEDAAEADEDAAEKTEEES